MKSLNDLQNSLHSKIESGINYVDTKHKDVAKLTFSTAEKLEKKVRSLSVKNIKKGYDKQTKNIYSKLISLNDKYIPLKENESDSQSDK